MPDHWGFVSAAYGLTAAVLVFYWRRLAAKERELERSAAQRSHIRVTAERSREPSRTAHPRPEPGARSPLQ